MSHASFLSDPALAARAVAGDAAAVAELVERFGPAAYDLAALLTNDPALAARLTADALVALGKDGLSVSSPRRALLLDTAVAARWMRSRQRPRRPRHRRNDTELAGAFATLAPDDALLLALTVRAKLPDTDVAPLIHLAAEELPAARERALEQVRAGFVIRRAHGRWGLLRGAVRTDPDHDRRHLATCRRCRELEPELPAAAALVAGTRPVLARELLDDLRFRVARDLALLTHDGVADRAPAAALEPVRSVPPPRVARARPRAPRGDGWWPWFPRFSRGATAGYGQGPSLGVLLTVAILSVLGALFVARAFNNEVPLAPEEPAMAAWPTLPARVVPAREPTSAIAMQPPTATAVVSTATVRVPTAPSAAPTGAVPATAPAAPSPTPPAPTAPPAVAVNPTPTPLAYAAARGAPVPVPPAPRTIGPAPGAASATTTAAASPTATGTLRVTTTDLAFGVETGPRTIEFSNTGQGPVTWQAVGDSTWLTIVPASGTLAAGEAARIAVTVDRDALPTGSYTGAVELRAPTSTEIVGVGMVVSPTRASVTTFDAPAQPINAAGCASPTTLPVAVEVAADSPPRQVRVYYALNGGTEQNKQLTAAGKRYTAVLGDFNEPGAVTYSFVITEADGTISRTTAQSVSVQDCPSRVRRVPVTLPASRRLELSDRQHDVYTFTITEPGNLIAQLSWTGTTPRLSTLLYGPRHTGQPYEQRTGTTTLAFSFPVTAADVAAGGTWALHVVNYEVGTATGTLVITFEPAGAPIPSAAPTPPPSPTPAATPATPSPSPPPAPGSPPAAPATATPTRTPTTTPAATPVPVTPSSTVAPTRTPVPTAPPPTATPPP